uniref:GTPase-associated adaptor domain-containing protein n=2 Tax=unclassified bacterial viruses TaxID=12333 RepID=A0AAU6VYJ7_9VIRU
MNRELAHAFSQLRVSQRTAVLQDINLNLHQAKEESNTDFMKRCLEKIACAGLVRELENSMERFL